MREVRTQCTCCSGRLECLQHLYDQEGPDDLTYSLVRCLDCGFEFIQDPPLRSEIFRHYQSQVNISEYATELNEKIPLIKRFLFRLDAHLLLPHLRPDDLILDVGSGLGTFANYLQQKGVRVVATDFVSESSWIRKNISYVRLDLNAVDFDIENLRHKLGSKPRAIILRHVLEHVYDPAYLLTKLAELDPDYFLIIVPNGRSVWRYIFRRHWGFFDPPRHLSNFSRLSLANLFGRVGYTPAKFVSYGMDEMVVSLYRLGKGWAPSLRRLFSWTSLAMRVSSAASLLLNRSVLVMLAKKSPSVDT